MPINTLAHVLKHEGGYVNHPKDPGGATNKGITQATYNAWRRRKGRGPLGVKHISDSEVKAIYRAQYWNAIRADDLPAGLDYAVFDFAVNSGPARAARFLQNVLGVAQDGVIGEHTLAAVNAMPTRRTISLLMGRRLRWLRGLRTFKHFGRGWTRRVQNVEATALEMLNTAKVELPKDTAPAPGKSEDNDDFLDRFMAALSTLFGRRTV